MRGNPPSHSPATPRALPPIVTLTLRVYARLIVACLPELRRSHETELLQVLRQCCRDAYAARGARGVVALWLPLLGDLLTGASADYLALLTRLWKESWMMNRWRTSAITIFCAYIAFVVAGMGFQKSTEDIIKAGVQDAHPLLSVSFFAVEAGAGIALLAVLAGGLPLALAALRYARATRRRDIPALFAVPVVALAALVGYVVVATHLAVPRATGAPLTTSDRVLAISVIAVFVLGAIVSTGAVALAIARSEIDSRLLRYTRLPAAITTLAMALMLVAVLIWDIALRLDAPQFFNGNYGLLASSTLLSVALHSVVMAVATVIALAALLRSQAPRQPERTL